MEKTEQGSLTAAAYCPTGHKPVGGGGNLVGASSGRPVGVLQGSEITDNRLGMRFYFATLPGETVTDYRSEVFVFCLKTSGTGASTAKSGK